MVISNRRRWLHGLGLLLTVAVVHSAGAHAAQRHTPALEPTPALTARACRVQAQRLVQRAAAERQIYAQIAQLLNAKQYRQAVPALRRAAQQHDDAWAGFALGDLYAAGLGVPRAAHTAFHWYLWAARRGNPFAQRRVANAYLHGVGTARDPAAAAHWFRIGMAPWQIAGVYAGLAQTYAHGHLVPVNRAKVRYYRRASLAELRSLLREPNAAAAYDLGIAYARGQGVRPDRARAVTELCRAVALHDTRAAAALLHLEDASP